MLSLSATKEYQTLWFMPILHARFSNGSRVASTVVPEMHGSPGVNAIALAQSSLAGCALDIGVLNIVDSRNRQINSLPVKKTLKLVLKNAM
jgi:hypothetical protein